MRARDLGLAGLAFALASAWVFACASFGAESSGDGLPAGADGAIDTEPGDDAGEPSDGSRADGGDAGASSCATADAAACPADMLCETFEAPGVLSNWNLQVTGGMVSVEDFVTGDGHRKALHIKVQPVGTGTISQAHTSSDAGVKPTCVAFDVYVVTTAAAAITSLAGIQTSNPAALLGAGTNQSDFFLSLHAGSTNLDQPVSGGLTAPLVGAWHRVAFGTELAGNLVIATLSVDGADSFATQPTENPLAGSVPFTLTFGARSAPETADYWIDNLVYQLP